MININNNPNNFNNIDSNSRTISSIVLYDNIDPLSVQENILRLASLNRDKSGIYLWTNKINNKAYLGSSVYLSKIYLKYFNGNALVKNHMLINLA